MNKTAKAEALTTLNKTPVMERTALDNAVLFSRHGEVGQAAIELLEMRSRIAELEGERDALRDALEEFNVEEPIGVSKWWLNSFAKARRVLSETARAAPGGGRMQRKCLKRLE